MATRRRFIRKCSTFAATVACVQASAGSARPSESVPDAAFKEAPAFERFAQQVLSLFRVVLPQGGACEVQLFCAELTPITTLNEKRSADSGHERFRLVFRGQGAVILNQSTYRFQHAKLGEFDLFIVSIGAEEPQVRFYEAVFNRSVPSRGEEMPYV